MTTETRITDPSTGGQKGDKLRRFDLIPPDVLGELADHYGAGVAKYPNDDPEWPGQANWQRGYAWHLCLAALLRHLMAWAEGEDVDEETGSNHLIAVAWHAFALRWFQIHDKGTDDIAGRQKARGLAWEDVVERTPNVALHGGFKPSGDTLDAYFNQFPRVAADGLKGGDPC